MAEGEFCVVCGRSTLPVVEGLCAECFANRTRLVGARSPAEVIQCPTCGARRVGGGWSERGRSSILTDEDLRPLLEVHPEVGIRRIRWEETVGNPMQPEYLGTAAVRVRGIEREVSVPLTVRVVAQSCPDCSRKSGHFYTAVLQLRGPAAAPRGSASHELRNRLQRMWDRLLPEARAEWRKAVSWREEVPEGWNYYLVDTLAARGIARLWKLRAGASVKESPSLVGRRNGEDVYRVTFAVRLPPLGGASGASPSKHR